MTQTEMHPETAVGSRRVPFDGMPPSPVDTRARAMARFEQDEDFFDRIVPLFRQAALEQSRALEQAAREGDAAQIQHWAHTLKGSLLTVGATEPAAHAETIEQRAGKRRLDDLGEAIGQLVAETAVIVEHLMPDARAAGA
jgi:HPt (histidine-containing phosphotransfer) domain-containing protein